MLSILFAKFVVLFSNLNRLHFMILTFNPLGRMQKKEKEILLISLWRGLFILRKLSELRNLHDHDLNAANALFEYAMEITKFAIAVPHLSTGAKKKIFIDFLCAFMPILLTLEPLCVCECV